MNQYKICEACDAALDPGERCSCTRRPAIPQNGDLVVIHGDMNRPFLVMGSPYMFGGKLVAECRPVKGEKRVGQLGMYFVEDLSRYEKKEHARR